MWTSTTLAVLYGCTFLLTGPGFANGQLVTSFSGTYQGSTLTGDNGQPYNAFRGIPYAEPPTDNLRFKKTVPIAPFFGRVYNATEFGPFCIQDSAWIGIMGPGQEDCLYLNVFTPTTAPTDGTLRKVFVYIHGGSNLGGNSNIFYPGTLVTTFDLVVVTLNYRLGTFGFLSTLTPDCLGNFGLWDQIRALEWVRDNIQAFGGDPQAVTLGGESAGAFDASVLALSTGVQRLFQRVIALSKATGLSVSGWNENPLAAAIKAARSLGCVKEEDKNPVTEADWTPVITCLRQVPAQRLANTSALNFAPSDVFSAVKDGDLFPYGPYEIFKNKQYLETTKVLERDYLVSVLQNDGSLAQMAAGDKTFDRDAVRGAVAMTLTIIYGNVSDKVIDKVTFFYMNYFDVSPLNDLAADFYFNLPAVQYVEGLTQEFPRRQSKAYLLYFKHFPKFLTGDVQGMAHAVDLLYLFDAGDLDVIKTVPYPFDPNGWGQVDRALNYKYMHMVSEFIKTGNPNKGLGGDLICDWPPFDPERRSYLQFSEFSEVKNDLKGDRVRLWRDKIPTWIKQYP